MQAGPSGRTALTADDASMGKQIHYFYYVIITIIFIFNYY